MTDLYPPIEPRNEFFLDVTDGHQLYVSEAGNPGGRPVVVLHGGPGAGCQAKLFRFFDPGLYRVFLLDQRGAGRSTPLGALEGNTTADLIADLEVLRAWAGVDRWMLFGGSWGSTLALAYAERYPDHVAAAVLRGIWLGRPTDIYWLIEGLADFVPDRFEKLVRDIPELERRDLFAAFAKRLESTDPVERYAAARAWCNYEQQNATLSPKPQSGRSDDQLLALARIEVHYFRNGCFLDPAALVAGARHLAGVPAVLVHGRHDLLAPLSGALELAHAWPNAELQIVACAGHSAFEPAISAALVGATDKMARASPWR